MIFPNTSYQKIGLTNRFVFKAQPCTLLLLVGYNVSNAIKYVQIFDSAVFEVNGTNALVDIQVPPNGSFSFQPFFSENNGGFRLLNGLTVELSTTPQFLTLDAGLNMWPAVQTGLYI